MIREPQTVNQAESLKPWIVMSLHLVDPWLSTHHLHAGSELADPDNRLTIGGNQKK